MLLIASKQNKNTIGAVMNQGRSGLGGRLPWIQAMRGYFVYREVKKKSNRLKVIIFYIHFALSILNKFCDKLLFPVVVAFHMVSHFILFFPVALINQSCHLKIVIFISWDLSFFIYKISDLMQQDIRASSHSIILKYCAFENSGMSNPQKMHQNTGLIFIHS